MDRNFRRFFRAVVSAGVLAGFSSMAAMGGGFGCNNTSDPHNGKNDKDYNATAQDAVDTATAVGNVALQSFSQAFGSSAALSAETSALILDHLKDAVTASSMTICDPAAFPAPSGSSLRINGSVGGYCNVAFEGNAGGGTARANCSSFDDGDAGGRSQLVGLVGIEGSMALTGGQEIYDLNSISSQFLTITTVGGNNCTVVLNLGATIDKNADGTGTAAFNGCVRVCGESYDVTGSSAF